jgi:hypothetical protein
MNKCGAAAEAPFSAHLVRLGVFQVKRRAACPNRKVDPESLLE